jgi:hypothetical protein
MSRRRITGVVYAEYTECMHYVPILYYPSETGRTAPGGVHADRVLGELDTHRFSRLRRLVWYAYQSVTCSRLLRGNTSSMDTSIKG